MFCDSLKADCLGASEHATYYYLPFESQRVQIFDKVALAIGFIMCTKALGTAIPDNRISGLVGSHIVYICPYYQLSVVHSRSLRLHFIVVASGSHSCILFRCSKSVWPQCYV